MAVGTASGQAEVRARRRPAQGGELVAKGEVLDREFGTGPETRAKASEQVQEQVEHGPGDA